MGAPFLLPAGNSSGLLSCAPGGFGAVRSRAAFYGSVCLVYGAFGTLIYLYMFLYKIGSMWRLCGQAACDHGGVTICYSSLAFI